MYIVHLQLQTVPGSKVDTSSSQKTDSSFPSVPIITKMDPPPPRKPAVLSRARKNRIEEFKDISCRELQLGLMGTDLWRDNLLRHLRDPGIARADIDRWIEAHPWITLSGPSEGTLRGMGFGRPSVHPVPSQNVNDEVPVCLPHSSTTTLPPCLTHGHSGGMPNTATTNFGSAVNHLPEGCAAGAQYQRQYSINRGSQHEESPGTSRYGYSQAYGENPNMEHAYGPNIPLNCAPPRNMPSIITGIGLGQLAGANAGCGPGAGAQHSGSFAYDNRCYAYPSANQAGLAYFSNNPMPPPVNNSNTTACPCSDCEIRQSSHRFWNPPPEYAHPTQMLGAYGQGQPLGSRPFLLPQPPPIYLKGRAQGSAGPNIRQRLSAAVRERVLQRMEAQQAGPGNKNLGLVAELGTMFQPLNSLVEVLQMGSGKVFIRPMAEEEPMEVRPGPAQDQRFQFQESRIEEIDLTEEMEEDGNKNDNVEDGNKDDNNMEDGNKDDNNMEEDGNGNNCNMEEGNGSRTQ